MDVDAFRERSYSEYRAGTAGRAPPYFAVGRDGELRHQSNARRGEAVWPPPLSSEQRQSGDPTCHACETTVTSGGAPLSVAAASDSTSLDVPGESCLRNPLREICTVGSVREEYPGGAMADLNGLEAGNGGHSRGKPTAYRNSSTRRDVEKATPVLSSYSEGRGSQNCLRDKMTK